jgi:uncharacterized protein
VRHGRAGHHAPVLPPIGDGSLSATVRLYAELGDFVAPARRQHDIVVRFDVGPTVKDAVEGIGVPHTEIALLVVDGEAVGFSHRLTGGERVSVFPAFTSVALPAGVDLRPPPHPVLRFVVDVHLAPLARFLRLLGFDTVLARPDQPDAELARRAAAEQRVVLTRDRGLLKRRVVTHGHYVRGDDAEAQVRDLARRFPLASWMAPFTRCLVCNGELVPVDKAAVSHRLEPGTRRAHDDFRRCAACERIFWPGSHHARLSAVVAGVSAAGEDGRRSTQAGAEGADP